MSTKVLSDIERKARSAENTEVAMSAQHDRLAQVLQDISERFPEDAFSKHGRLRGLLADHLPDAEREIRVALDAIDEGVVDMYANTAAEELGMRIDRLVMRLENSRGIREDIGRPVILAYGYALGAGELPSATLTAARQPEQIATEVNDSGDDWIGATVIANSQNQQASDPGPQPAVHSQGPHTQHSDSQSAHAASAAPASGSRNGMIALGVAAILGLAYIGNQPDPVPVSSSPTTGEQQTPTAAPAAQEEKPVQTPQQVPAQETVEEVVATKPAPTVKPTSKPSTPTVSPRSTPPPSVAANTTAYWYDPYGVVWQIEFDGAEFQGIGRQNNVPVASVIGILDPVSNQIQYELYNALDVPMGVGEGTMTDPTHIQFVTYDGFGLVIGQGTFHINHPPNA